MTIIPLAVYIHWPFCKAKCPYCDFNSHVRDHVDATVWQQALLQELEYTARMATQHCVRSIFFGGGTPSLMPPEIVETTIAKVHTLWPCEKDLEITLEANPTSVEAQKFAGFKAAGVNRLSLGVQSLRPDVLKFLGREHSPEQAIAAIELAREYFDRYSFDLIYARPQQTPEDWEVELQEALALAGGHLSLYQLTIEENTAFHTAYAKGAFTLPDEDTSIRLYAKVTEALTSAHGLASYEVSNYARPGQESRHNLAYWLGADYVGIGAGAHGRITVSDGTRHATLNLKSPERWLASVQQHGHGSESVTALSSREAAEERLMLGLRIRTGVPIAEVAAHLDTRQHQYAIASGLLEASPTHLIPTAKGRLVLTSLTSLLLENS